MTTADRRPVAIDLFAGAGGLSLGLESAGFNVVAATDYDPVHAATHEYNFPRTEVLCADVATLDADELSDAAVEGARRHGRPELGEVDLVAGGPPCQGFSLMGKRLVDDTRNSLIFHFLRLVTEIEPRYFVMENVPGMMTGGHTELLDQLVREFKEADYAVVQPVEILSATDYGVPQLRRRVFLVGARDGEELPSYPTPTHGVPDDEGLLEDGLLHAPTVGDALLDLPNLDNFAELVSSDRTTLSDQEHSRMLDVASQYARWMHGAEVDDADLSHPRSWDPKTLTSSRRTQHTAKSVSRFEDTNMGKVEPISRFLRLHVEGQCNTLRAGTGRERGAYTSPRPIHPVHPRVISVREAARLHSMPDWFRLHTTKWHGFRQVGNAVPPLLGRAVGRELVGAMGLSPARPTETVALGEEELLSLSMDQAAEHFGADRTAIPKARERGAA